MQRFTQHLPYSERIRRILDAETANVPLTEPIAADQVQSSDGSFVWGLDHWARALRFLILGTEGGTYYITERKLTQENAAAVKQCILEDGARLVNLVIDVSTKNRAASNDPALFALAMAVAHGDAQTKVMAYEALPQVARIGTHLFHFVSYVNDMRGWGRGLRNAVASWYNEKQPKELALQLTKYQSRDTWSHRDVLRLAHPRAPSPSHEHMYKLAVGKVNKDGDVPLWVRQGRVKAPEKRSRRFGEKRNPAAPPLASNAQDVHDAWQYLGAVRSMRADMPVAAAVSIIKTYGLQREVIPTELLTKREIWEALLPNLGLMATIRNLATLTRIGILAPMSETTRMLATRIADEKSLLRQKVHPMALLIALKTYQQGKGEKGQYTWEPVREIVDALDAAFYLSFGSVQPAGNNHLLAVDVSGSMDGSGYGGGGFGYQSGVFSWRSSFPDVRPGLSPRMCAAAMAMLAMKTEPYTHLTAFSHQLQHISTASPRQRLDDVLRMFQSLPVGPTDCSLPMRYATFNNLEIDTFVVYTDSETNTGAHPKLMLERYRQKSGRNARLIVVGMVSNGFTIADPNDRGMLDVVGFDAGAPPVMAAFARGEL